MNLGNEISNLEHAKEKFNFLLETIIDKMPYF
jgi:hypothetical protein